MTPLWLLAVCLVCPLVISWLLTTGLIRWAPQLGLLDLPSERKVHTRPTPRGGGLAIYAAVLATSLLLSFVWQQPVDWTPLLLGLVIVVLGLVDDLRPQPWQLRLGVQSGVAVVAVVLAVPAAGWWTGPLAVLWLVGLTNAFNMLDNMDALSAGVAWIASAVLALTCLWTSADVSGYLLLLAGLTGFLWFNRPPARIFMGDAGSTFLGFFLGLGSVRLALSAKPPWSFLIPPAIFAVPCYDLVSVVLLRLSQGRSPFQADKQHLSHRLVQSGLSSPWAVAVIHLLALASGAGGLLYYVVVSWTGAILVGVQLALWWGVLAVVDWLPRRSRA